MGPTESEQPTASALLALMGELARRMAAGSADLAGARLLLVAAAGSWADGCWAPGHDVDLRAVYALPADRYLGLTSYRDEHEAVYQLDGWEIDWVAFEVAKAARLVIKGHPGTLAWLTRHPPLMVEEDARVLVEAARHHTDQMSTEAARATESGQSSRADSPVGPTSRGLPTRLYQRLDALVRRARLHTRGE